METTDIREELHQCIDRSDDILIKLMLALAKEYNNSKDYDFSEEEIKSFDERRLNRLSGKSHVYTWQEAKKLLQEMP